MEVTKSTSCHKFSIFENSDEEIKFHFKITNMKKIQDTDITNTNNNSNVLMDDEYEQKVTYLLTQKVDEVTGSQMKKVEVQKMEDDLTIKMLEREYLEDKRNFIYSKKKLEDTRKKVSTQSEMINQLLQVNKAIVEKFNELKRFQREFINVNVNNAEKTSINCINKNNELSSTFQMITENESYSKHLNTNISDKKKQLNSDVQEHVEDRKVVRDNLIKILTTSRKKVETLKVQLAQDKVDNDFEGLIEQQNEKIIQLETNGETFHKQCKQEIDDLIQEKKKKIQELDISKRGLEEKKEFLSKLESELLLSEKNKTTLDESLKRIQSKHEAILSEVIKKREDNELSNQEYNENIKKINIDQNKINSELQIAKNKFSQDENDMHIEMNSFLAKIEEKKILLKELEGYQQDLNKLNETKRVKQKALSSNKELQDKLKILADEFKKHEQIILNKNRKQSELAAKIEDLQEKKRNIKKKLESSFNDEENVIQIFEAKPVGNNIKYFHKDKTATQHANSQKELIYSSNKTEHESNDISINSYSPNKAILSKSSSIKSIYSFDLDETDESDDEVNVRNIASKKSEESNVNAHKITTFNVNQDDQSDDTIHDNLSQSDKLFDDLLSRKTSKSLTPSKDTNLFKIPQTYMTPIRKKPNQSKKYS